MTGESLFSELVAIAARTLGRSVAPFTLSRLFLRVGILDRSRLTAADVRRALPVVEAGLAEFLTPDELRSTLHEFDELLAKQHDGGGRADGGTAGERLPVVPAAFAPRRIPRSGQAPIVRLPRWRLGWVAIATG